MRRPKQLNYIQKKLVDIKYYIYGSNKYLEKNGMPKTIGDLNKHKFISFGKGAPSPVYNPCLLYTSPSPRDRQKSRMPSSA